jgi:hypothetical protein
MNAQNQIGDNNYKYSINRGRIGPTIIITHEAILAVEGYIDTFSWHASKKYALDGWSWKYHTVPNTCEWCKIQVG